MPKANDRNEDARRQGQFEGQVLTTLSEIKTKMETFNANFSGLEIRVRANETAITSHNEMFRDSENAHKELFSKIGDLANIATNLVNYQNKQRGFIIAVGTVGPIVSSVITVLVLKLFTHS